MRRAAALLPVGRGVGRALLGGRGALEPVWGGAHVRGLWWGYDTLEDKEQRRRKAEAKGIIAWTDPEAALDEKKELSWSPERIEEEARMALKLLLMRRKSSVGHRSG